MRCAVAALIAFALVAAGTARSDGTQPGGPPPRVEGAGAAPPPAWIEGRRGAQWIAYSSFCMIGATPDWPCVDAARAPCKAIPQVVAQRGDILRIHLPFALPVRRLRVAGFGERRARALVADASPHVKSASYVFCVVKRRSSVPPFASTTLSGRVVLDPSTPVCSRTVPCSRPLPGFLVAFARDGVRVATATTDRDGWYTVSLRPGVYSTSAPGPGRRGSLTPFAILVPAAPAATLAFSYDVGIR